MTSTVDFTGKPVKNILVTINLAKPAAAKQLAETAIEVAGDHLYVQSPGHRSLELQLPFSVSAQGATAFWEKETQQLCLNLPYLSCRDLFQQVSCGEANVMYAPHSLACLGALRGCDCKQQRA